MCDKHIQSNGEGRRESSASQEYRNDYSASPTLGKENASVHDITVLWRLGVGGQHGMNTLVPEMNNQNVPEQESREKRYRCTG